MKRNGQWRWLEQSSFFIWKHTGSSKSEAYIRTRRTEQRWTRTSQWWEVEVEDGKEIPEKSQGMEAKQLCHICITNLQMETKILFIPFLSQ